MAVTSTTRPIVIITQEEGPSPKEKADIQKIKSMAKSPVYICRDGDEEGICETVKKALHH